MNRYKKIFSYPILISIFLLIFNGIIITKILITNIEIEKRKNHHEVYEMASKLVMKINDVVNLRSAINQAVASYIEQNPTLTQEEFESYIASLLKNNSDKVKFIGYTCNDFKVTMIYPYNEESMQYIGLDLISKQRRTAHINECIKADKIFIEGPIKLTYSDEDAFVSFVPVWEKNEFRNMHNNKLLGIAHLVIESEKFYEITGISSCASLDIALKGEDGLGTDGSVFYGDSSIFMKNDRVEFTIELPNGEWVLAVCPKDGCMKVEIQVVFIFFYIIALMFSILLYVVIKYSVHVIRKTEKKYRYLIDNSMDIIWSATFDTKRFTFINNAVKDASGYTREEYLQMSIYDVLAKQSSILFDKAIEDAIDKYQKGINKKIAFSLELQRYNKLGYILWISVSVTVILDKYNKPFEIVGVTTDIDERKKLESLLRESENQYRTITEHSRDLIWKIDAKTFRYTFISGAISSLTGFEKEEYLQMSIYDKFDKNSSAMLENKLNEAVEKYRRGETETIELFLEVLQLNKNGGYNWIEISAIVTTDEAGEPNEIIGASRIIDERKKFENTIKEKQYELQKLNAEKDKFFSIIAHDLKNPIAALLNVSDVFADFYKNMSSEEVEINIKKMSNAAYHTHKLLENLLEWAKSSRGEFVYFPLKINLDEAISDCINNIKIQAINKNININTSNTLSEINVEADINMLRTIIRNLISNAIKFSPNSSTIEINAVEYPFDDKFIQIDIKDSGVGMPPETIAKLFRIDEKISTKGTNNETGTGLGLILCKEFIDKHKCRIWVKSELNKGTTFSFTLPKA